MSLLLAVALSIPAVTQAGDPAKDLRAKDPLVRLAAVRELVANDHKKREKLLTTALKDDDWEVVEAAARALGEVGSADAAGALAKLSLEGPVARVRRAAAESLGQLDAEEGFDDLAKKVTSDEAEAACLAMCALAPSLDGQVSLKPIEKALKSKEAPVRIAAARAAVRLSGEERAKRLADLLEHEEVAVRAAAVEAAGASEDPACVPVLLDALAAELLPDVIERRIPASLVQILAAADGDARAGVVATVRAAPATVPKRARVRAVRMLGRVAAMEHGLISDVDAVTVLEEIHPDCNEPTRAAIGTALGRIGTDAALLRAAAIARGDESAVVRRASLRGVTRRRSAETSEEARELALDLCADADAGVREDAAVALGVEGEDRAVKALAGLLDDASWEVVVAAAVSLGKTRHVGAVSALAPRLEAEDWRVRGAAVVGLGHLYAKEAIPHIIDALEDADGLVRRTAHEYLIAVAKRRFPEEVEPWRTWWAENEKRVVLFDPKEEAARREKYGYERSAAEIYEGLDVLVFESRGDHIQNVLTHLAVDHRLTMQGRVAEDGPHARAVFVSNCTGEMTEEDVARLAWFVRVGGYLFGSCWAVQETIERAIPGVVGRLGTRGEVLDNVPASPCAPDSPYLEGVFGPDVTPIYALEGAFLIRVIDPERCEVLVDSPVCYDRWGGGNLAAWFPAGHGVVLDSVNHFDEQGLARATWLKKPEERQAYAIDHLGMTFAELRAVADERWWKKTTESAEQVKDLSVFRLITNFVRQKRIAGDG